MDSSLNTIYAPPQARMGEGARWGGGGAWRGVATGGGLSTTSIFARQEMPKHPMYRLVRTLESPRLILSPFTLRAPPPYDGGGHKSQFWYSRMCKNDRLRYYSGNPVTRSASLREAASAGAQSTPENCRLYRNAGCNSKTRAAAALDSSSRPSFASGAASSM